MKLCKKTRCIMPADICYHADNKKQSLLRNAPNVFVYTNLVDKFVQEIISNLSDKDLIKILSKVSSKEKPFKQQVKILTNEFRKRENEKLGIDGLYYDENICECCGQVIDY